MLISTTALSETGPSVVSENGGVASLGVTALMDLATGLKLPYETLTYRGDLGHVTHKTTVGLKDCYYCKADLSAHQCLRYGRHSMRRTKVAQI